MMSPTKIWSAAAVGLVLISALLFYKQAFYTVDSTEIAIFQAPFTGTQSVKAAPGTYSRFGASVDTYNKQDTYAFEYVSPADPKNPEIRPKDDHSIMVQFNDGGKAWIGGNVQWDMPQLPDCAIALHNFYRSQQGVDQTLIRNAINNAMTLTAPLMSATESYAARRAEFIQSFSDQLINGIYLTETADVQQRDTITGEMKSLKLMTIIKDKKTGLPMRTSDSPFKKYCINIQSPTLTHFVYEPKVELQIQSVRDNTVKIQTQQAEARAAEQTAITVEANGRATAARAKWEQEAIKATEVTQAEKNAAVQKLNAERDKLVAETAAQRDLNVAQFASQAAEQYRVQQIKIGEGDAERKKLVFQADGALQQKIDGYVRTVEATMNGLARYQGAIVPQFMMGAAGAGQGTAANAFEQFAQSMSMRAMKDLSLDMSMTRAAPVNPETKR